MEKVGNLLRPNEHSRQSKGSSKPLPNKVIARVWTRMAEVYGHKWVSQYGESTDAKGNLTSAANTWAEGLSPLSLEAISKGFSKMVDAGDPWPPSLPEFIQMCRADKLAAPYHRLAPPMTEQPDPEQRKYWAKQLHKLQRG